MKQNLTIFLVLTGIFCLGLWGQYERQPHQFSTHTFLLSYQVLSLFAFEGEWTYSINLPWQLEITRLLAPLATITGVLLALMKGSWFNLLNFFVRYKRDHVVVAGLGEKSWQFIQFAHEDNPIVVIELDPENKLIPAAREIGVYVFVGDALARDLYSRINLKDAKHLITLTGNNGLNVDLGIKARNHMREHGRQQLRIHLHLDDSRVAQSLASYPKFFSDHRDAQIDFFSVYDLTARILFTKYNPDRFASVFNQSQVHIVLYQFGNLAQHILTEALRTGHYANQQQLRFTIIDAQAEEKGQLLFRELPHLKFSCELEFISLNPVQTSILDELEDGLLQSVTQHVVCDKTDEENLQISLNLRTSLLSRKGSNAPILVRMQHSSGLAGLLESNVGGPEIPDGLFPFGMLDEVLHHNNVLSDGLDTLARAIHEDYLQRRQALEADKRLYSTLNAWQNLPEPDRKSNRLQADHLATKLRAIDCRLVDTAGAGFSFTESETELLARMEHDRWRFNKEFTGWKSGPSRIESAKINPYAISWQDLPEDDRVSERASIQALPELLKNQLGLGIRRECRVAFTGQLNIDIDDSALRETIDRKLGSLIEECADSLCILVSPLAEGIDRIAAEIALTKYNLPLEVPLPLPYELYTTDFQDEASIEEFKRLVGLAEFYYELPLKFGSIGELALAVGETHNEARNQQYALANSYLIEHCDKLIAI